MHIVSSYDYEHHKKAIYFGKAHAYGNGGKLINIYYKHDYDNYMFLMQTPHMKMPYSGLYDDRGNVSIELCGNNTTSDFFAFLTQLETRICKHISKRHDVANKQFISVMRHADEFYPQRLKLRGIPHADLHVFGSKKETLKWSDVHKEESLVCLFVVRHVWISKDVYGMRIQLLQIQKTEPSFAHCLITLFPSHDPYETYRRMQKAGINKDAITHKMRLDGLSQATIDGFFVSSLQQQQQQPQQPPPPPPLRSALLGNIQAGITLKKVLPEDGSSNKRNKVLANVDTDKGFKPPSLDALLSMRAKLKSVTRYEQNI